MQYRIRKPLRNAFYICCWIVFFSFFCYSSATRCFSEETQSFLLFSQTSQIQLDQFRNASIVTETFSFNMYYFSILEPYFASYNFQRVDSFDDWIYKNLAWNVK